MVKLYTSGTLAYVQWPSLTSVTFTHIGLTTTSRSFLQSLGLCHMQHDLTCVPELLRKNFLVSVTEKTSMIQTIRSSRREFGTKFVQFSLVRGEWVK